MAKKHKKDWIKSFGIAIFIVVALLSFLYANSDRFFGDRDTVELGDDSAYVDFIDCGQGDSSLLVSDGVVTLIDATTDDEAEKVIAHLKKRKIERIDHFVLTHPHEDHIGGADEVLDAFDVQNIYMKRPTSGTEPTTSVYINLLKKIKSQGKKVTAVKIGDSFRNGEFSIEIIGPLKDYEDLNDQSIIVQASVGEYAFLFTGDQESTAEKDLVEHYGTELQSIVLKAGHHGSKTSSCEAFLDAVSPQYAVISCGEDNSFGHPHKETIDRFEDRHILYYRTDLHGTITFRTNGVAMEAGRER